MSFLAFSNASFADLNAGSFSTAFATASYALGDGVFGGFEIRSLRLQRRFSVESLALYLARA